MKKWRRFLVVGSMVVFAPSSLLFSQTRVPITQDGKPAVLEQKPAPRTASGKPDFSGIWAVPSNDERKILADRFGPDKPEPVSMTRWAAERYEYNQDSRPVPGYDPKKFLGSQGGGRFGARPELNPFYKCLPAGTPNLITGWGSISPQEIIQSDKRVLMIYEYDSSMRQIWTDGSQHPDPVDLTWTGHSIGTWEGDVLVVDTVGIRNENWLDGGGHVASPGLHVVERYRRIDNETLQIDFTYDDPKAFTKPWTRRQFRRLRPTWKLIEDARCYPGSPEIQVQESGFNQLFTEQ